MLRASDAGLWKSHGQGHRWLFGKRAEVQGPRNYEVPTEQDDQRLRTPKQNMPLKHVEIFIKDYDSMAPNKQASSEEGEDESKNDPQSDNNNE
ncbi:DNA polymerase [Trichinella spiralis]|uniref:DNA polymerase n=2 Tax=Trichinella spiralis TaxID=6334 RepID=A0ABR3KX72_TRISP